MTATESRFVNRLSDANVTAPDGDEMALIYSARREFKSHFMQNLLSQFLIFSYAEVSFKNVHFNLILKRTETKSLLFELFFTGQHSEFFFYLSKYLRSVKYCMLFLTKTCPVIFSQNSEQLGL